MLGAVVVDHGQERGPVAAVSHQVLQQREEGRLPRGQVLSAIAHLRVTREQSLRGTRASLPPAARAEARSRVNCPLDKAQNSRDYVGKLQGPGNEASWLHWGQQRAAADARLPLSTAPRATAQTGGEAAARPHHQKPAQTNEKQVKRRACPCLRDPKLVSFLSIISINPGH